MMNKIIVELEDKAKDLLSTIQLIKSNPNSKDQNYDSTIGSFFENISGLDEFLKSMRLKGYFGMSRQNQNDLDQQQEMIEKLRTIREFVVNNYEKNKEIINQ
ncbi:hypothetical protein CMT22_00170 [Elizabethkingia anophelis]|nr:hypothetical protein [Elizabethkingia anophelis]MDV4095661.1 hypothetical protein [Elizabethkingia anophelis]HAY3591752.1 hypothetical protein [Elizabethkingia anophelis]